MEQKIGRQTKRELVEALRNRYQASAKEERSNLGSDPGFAEQLEGRLKEVQVQAGSLIEVCQRLTSGNAREFLMPHQTPDHRSILLFHPGLVILEVGATAGKFGSPAL